MGEHPLHRAWSMYYDSGRGMQSKQEPKGRHSWKAYSKICTFSTVEAFWRVFNNLVKVDQLDGKKDFFLFEDGIEPDWDDPGNAHGGLWLVHCNECLKADLADGKPAADATLDSLWRDTVYHTVGEQFPHSTEVVGVALNLRKTGARLAIWTRGSEGDDGLRAIGRDFRGVVHLPTSKSVGYARHAVSKKQQAGQFYWSGFQGQMSV